MVPWPAPTMVTRTSDACHPRSGALSSAPLPCVEVRCAPSPTDSSLQCDGSGSAPPASSGACNESAIALDACDPWTPSIPLLGNGCAEGATCAFLAVPFRPHQSCTRSKGYLMYRVARDFAVHEAMSGCTTQFDMRHGSISAASVQLHTVTRLSAATAVCRGGCVGRMRALQSNAHKKARLARCRPLRVTTCHPQLDLCPLRACTLRARGTRKACCLFGSLPNARSLSVSFRRALA